MISLCIHNPNISPRVCQLLEWLDSSFLHIIISVFVVMLLFFISWFVLSFLGFIVGGIIEDIFKKKVIGVDDIRNGKLKRIGIK